MRIFNQDKTQELFNIDTKLGRLVEDTLLVNIEEVQEVKEQGHYEVVCEYENGGKDVVWVVDVEGVKPQQARSEVEDILVYIPYTIEELNNIKKQELRVKREPLLKAYDTYKINVLYGIEVNELTIKENIDNWYRLILDLDENAINNPPLKISYYL